jgi:type I restriction enzyme M protein
MPVVIESERENERMLAIVAKLMDKGEDLSPEEEKILKLLARLIEDFEQRYYHPKEATPLEVLQHLMEALGVKLSPAEKKQILGAVSWRVDDAPPVIKTVHKPGKSEVDPLHGRYEWQKPDRQGGLDPQESRSGRNTEHSQGGLDPQEKPLLTRGLPLETGVVEYEPDAELRDTEQVPLLEEGGIEAFISREVLPYVPDAGIDESKTQIGYEISFTSYFYKPQPLRTLEEIRADIEALEKETEGLLEEVLVQAEAAR